jgi:hypothetical protein
MCGVGQARGTSMRLRFERHQGQESGCAESHTGGILVANMLKYGSALWRRESSAEARREAQSEILEAVHRVVRVRPESGIKYGASAFTRTKRRGDALGHR